MIQIQKDTLTRYLYANDASMYEEAPEGVFFPKNTADLQNLVAFARSQKKSITARAAGTSLAGQTTGAGIIADVSRFMTNILDYDSNSRKIHVEPGVIRDTINRKTAIDGLLFGPDTSTTNRCMIGGMIGNNSSGSYSITYGTTREHTLSMDCVLSDGSLVTFKALSDSELDEKCALPTLEGKIYREILSLLHQHKDLIFSSYPHPEVTRRNTGYALDELCKMSPITPGGPPFNLCALLCGSEGTLALTASAELNLVDLPKFKTLLIPHFENLDDAMHATVRAVAHHPAAVELLDKHVLDATKGNTEQNRNRFFLQGDPECILLIECFGETQQEAEQKAFAIQQDLNRAYAAPLFSHADDMRRAWDLRKAGLGLLMGMVSDEKTPTFAEDTAVRVADLPDYVRDFRSLMDKYNTNCVFYAHASVGELHLRPVLDIKTEKGLKAMKSMAEEVADLVKKYRGSLSGEHGDGRARAGYIHKVLGDEMMPILEQVKRIWDPENIFNPGKIVFSEPIDTHLRYHPKWKPVDVLTVFKWKRFHSFSEAVDMCNGAGVCRKRSESGGTMCPSYMATLDEKDSTRGRANVFRQVFTGMQKEAFSSEEIKEALDLCLSCKACKSECPANVDMAAMKAEFLNGWQEQNGKTLADWFYGRPSLFYPLASLFPRITNVFAQSELGKTLLYEFLGIARERNLPAFAETPFHSWWKKRQKASNTGDYVVLLVDYFTNYHNPEIAIAAVHVLEKMGFQVIIEAPVETGRTQISRGLLNDAKKVAANNISNWHEYSKQGIPFVCLEPSELSTIKDEYLDFFDGETDTMAHHIAERSSLLEDFVASHADRIPADMQPGRNRTVIVHGHCHTKALGNTDSLMSVLSAMGYLPRRIDAGCCGMAGSFGYDSKKYDISMQIGSQRLFPEIDSDPKSIICAHGFSCRHQISDGTKRIAKHPVELIDGGIRG